MTARMRPIYGCPGNFRESLTTPMATFPKILWAFVTIPLSALVYPKFRLQFSVGIANPQFWGRGGRRESGMVPFDIALVISLGRPQKLFVRDIAAFVLQHAMHVSHVPPLVSPKFPHVPQGVGGSPFGYEQRTCWANCLCN